MKRSPLTRKTPMKRTGRLKRGKGFHRYEGMAAFNLLVWDRDKGRSVLSGCQVREGTPAHHALPKRVLRRYGMESYVSDPRVGVTLTASEHEMVETGFLKIPRDCLPDGFFEAANEMGLDWWADAKYPKKED